MIGPYYAKEFVMDTNLYDDAESPRCAYDTQVVRGDYYKCFYCAYHHKRKQCGKIACCRNERKDGKTIIMARG